MRQKLKFILSHLILSYNTLSFRPVSRIPQYTTLEQKCAFLFQCGILRNMGQVHCEFCEVTPLIYLAWWYLLTSDFNPVTYISLFHLSLLFHICCSKALCCGTCLCWFNVAPGATVPFYHPCEMDRITCYWRQNETFLNCLYCCYQSITMVHLSWMFASCFVTFTFQL